MALPDSIYPGALDTFPVIEANSGEAAPGTEHDVVHEHVHQAVKAVQSTLGTTGSLVAGTVHKRLDDIEGAIVEIDGDLLGKAPIVHGHAWSDITGTPTTLAGYGITDGGGGSGTVTSVALAVPSGLGVSGSPVTGAGTLTITVDDAAVFRGAIGAGMGNGSVTSVDITPPASGITASGGPITGSGAITLALADDLAALEALTGTDTIYYRSGASAWSPVAIGANLTFSGGTLAATGGGGGPDYNIDGGTPSTAYGGSMTIDAGGP